MNLTPREKDKLLVAMVAPPRCRAQRSCARVRRGNTKSSAQAMGLMNAPEDVQ
jgi:hypothetical protein